MTTSIVRRTVRVLCQGDRRTGAGALGVGRDASQGDRLLGHTAQRSGGASAVAGLDHGRAKRRRFPDGTRGSSTGGPDSKISWNSWTASGATGGGEVWVSHLSPGGQQARYKGYPAKLSFSAPETLSFVTTLDGGHYRSSLVFTKMSVSFIGAVPAGWRRSQAFALKLLSKGFYYVAVPN